MNRMDFGMPTLIELDTIEDCIALCRELSLSFIEINMNMPQYQIELINANVLREALRNGIYFTFHLDENFNTADFNTKVSGAYLETMLETIKAAKLVGAPVINMHMAEGIYFSLPENKVYLFDKYNSHYMSRLLEFRDACEKAIGTGGVKICVENCGGYLPYMERGIELLLKSGAFRLTLDIGHSHSAKYADEKFIAKHINRLSHMHIHDAADGKCHLVLGTGEINLHEKLALAAQRGCRCVIETKSVQGLKESVSYLKRGQYTGAV